jgi:hypothetical protein
VRGEGFVKANIFLIREEVSASFFAKKEAKKLLFAAGCGFCRANAHGTQEFFASFFQKRSAFLLFGDICLSFW